MNNLAESPTGTFTDYLHGLLSYFSVGKSLKNGKMVRTGEKVAAAPSKCGEHMRITVAASQGGRRYMEDRCVVHTERDDKGKLLWTFVGVFDGHGGEHASEYVRRNLLMNIMRMQKFQSDDDDDILEAIRTGFLATHEEMRDVHDSWPYTASGYPSTAGTTVSVVFIRNGKLYTGHVGDSAIFLGAIQNGELQAIPLTIDHKPESAHEQLRIAKAGGETAVKSGVTRVIWKRAPKNYQNGPALRNTPCEMIPFLSVARSLGDLWSYNEATNMFVVSPEPDLGVHTLTGNDFCLVLASDGMTNVISGEQAVSIVFKEEDLMEANEEINRNHARCVLKTALQKWRSLRADNITVAAVIFDNDPFDFNDNEMLMKLGRYISCSQALADRQDAMLKVSPTDNILLATQRCPVIYNGSKDANFARVLYRGPGFRTHEEEILEERRNLISKLDGSAVIAIAGGSADAQRRPTSRTSGDDENVLYDDDEDDGNGEGEDEPFDPSEEIELSVRFNEDRKTLTILPSPQRPPRPHAPQPVFADESTFEPAPEPMEVDVDVAPTPEGVDSEDVNQKPTPARTPPGHTVRRVKAEAVRRLRTPKLAATSSSNESDCRITRSASRAMASTSPDSMVTSSKNDADFKTPSPRKPMTTPTKQNGAIGVNINFSPDACLLTPTRRSNRSNGVVMCTPIGISDPLMTSVVGGSSKLTMSRKRGRTTSSGSFVSSTVTSCSSTSTTRIAVIQQCATTIIATGVTPMVSSISLQDPYHLTTTTTSTPSRSAPGTPRKSEKPLKSASKWSLSKLDEQKKEMEMEKEKADADGIIRVSEVADEEEGDAAEDVMREPPSKIRRFFGNMRKFIWGK